MRESVARTFKTMVEMCVSALKDFSLLHAPPKGVRTAPLTPVAD
jgi:hypothetical protein